MNQGQVCCAGSRLLVQESIAPLLLAKLRRSPPTPAAVIPDSSHLPATFRGWGGHFCGRVPRLAARQRLLNFAAEKGSNQGPKWLRFRLESGLDCLVGAEFARQRCAVWGRGCWCRSRSHPSSPSRKASQPPLPSEEGTQNFGLKEEKHAQAKPKNGSNSGQTLAMTVLSVPNLLDSCMLCGVAAAGHAFNLISKHL